MKLASVRIQNFRGLEDVMVPLGDYTCLVGPNGSGKSTVIAALNVFFRHSKTASTDVFELQEEDFHRRNTAIPIEITLTFDDLSREAQARFRDYYRQGKLIVSAKAVWDEDRHAAEVRQHGIRLGLEKFRHYFALAAGGAKAPELKSAYEELRRDIGELPKATVREDMANALRAYEAGHPADCVEIPSADEFYGFTKGAYRLEEFVQWVHVPAIKDATEEGDTEGKETWLAQLLTRAVRSKVDFGAEREEIRKEAQARYEAMIDAQQAALSELSKSLTARMAAWSTPDADLLLRWASDQGSAIKVPEPFARVLAGDGSFQGSLVRHGCGFQRSYLLALLQELADVGVQGPGLLLACEEPELFQHPPQARYLASVFEKLSQGRAQVMVCTHSPLFVSGRTFEDIRIFHRCPGSACTMQWTTLEAITKILQGSGAPAPTSLSGAKAKLHQALQPRANEMFFTPVLILVEGIEDLAYISACLELTGRLDEYRRLGCHLVPADCKSKIPMLLAVAHQLGIPTFVVFDSDVHKTKESERKAHERDNSAILRLAGLPNADVMPTADQWFPDLVQWAKEIRDVVESEIGKENVAAAEQAVKNRGGLQHESALEKNALFIGLVLDELYAHGKRSPSLERLCDSIIAFAKSSRSPKGSG